MRWGLGPVFAYEWLIVSRKKSVYAFRFLFGGALLVVLALMAKASTNEYEYRNLSPIEKQAEAGKAFSASIIATGLSLILLAAPAATAGAICLDKQRGTLAHLMATDLSDAEIVLGKLGARLIPTLGLVLSTLGVAAIATLMGGIDPMGLLGAFFIMAGVAVLVASLAICLSVWATKTHEVIMMTYLLVVAWLMIQPIWRTVTEINAGMKKPPVWLAKSHPYMLALDQRAGGVPIHEPLLFLAGCLAASAIFAGLATIRVRAVASRQTAPKAKKGWRLRLVPLARRLSFLPGPSLDVNPVAWREWHRRKPSGWTRLIWTTFAIASFGCTAYGVYLCLIPDGWGKEAALILVNGFQVALGLLLLSAAASTSLAEERVRGSLDVLLATPLSTRSIVWGKWWGTFRTVPSLAILPTILAFAAAYDIWANPAVAAPPRVIAPHATRWMGVPIVWGLTLAYGAALTSLGLAMATWISRLGRAVGVTVTLYVMMTVAYCLLIAIFFEGPGNTGLAPGLMTGSPWMGVAWTSSLLVREQSYQPMLYQAQIAWGSFWILAYLSVAAILLLLTFASFNRFLGRMPEEGRPAPARRAKKEVRQAKMALAAESM